LAQADDFLSVVPDDPDALPPAVDLGLAGNCREWQVMGFAHVDGIEGRVDLDVMR
jgi:GH25 family lysozyme M1 (1,4-beta-N-acetylmuramidase)